MRHTVPNPNRTPHRRFAVPRHGRQHQHKTRQEFAKVLVFCIATAMQKPFVPYRLPGTGARGSVWNGISTRDKGSCRLSNFGGFVVGMKMKRKPLQYPFAIYKYFVCFEL